MEEFKPKRKNTAQPAQNGQSTPHTRKPRTPKPPVSYTHLTLPTNREV